MSDSNYAATDFAAIGYGHGYEYADTVGDLREYAEYVRGLAGAESDLWEAAYTDWSAVGLSGDSDDRQTYAAAHVRGQKSRVREILADRD